MNTRPLDGLDLLQKGSNFQQFPAFVNRFCPDIFYHATGVTAPSKTQCNSSRDTFWSYLLSAKRGPYSFELRCYYTIKVRKFSILKILHFSQLDTLDFKHDV